MKKAMSLVLAICLFVLSIALIGCSSNNSQSSNAPSETEKELSINIDSFTKGFEEADFNRFNSYAKDNGLGDTKIWFRGVITDYEEIELDLETSTQKASMMIVDVSDGSWLCNYELDYFDSDFDRIKELVNDEIIVKGLYDGYSDVYKMPVLYVSEFYDIDNGKSYSSNWTNITYEELLQADNNENQTTAETTTHEHVWTDATCTEPKTCSICGETEGEPLGHDTPDLTCTTDGVCTRCGETITAPGHQFSEATCTEPMICSVCGTVEGEPLGHTTTNGVCERCGLEVYETVYGYGDDVISGITTGDGIYRIRFTHDGSRNFSVWAYDATNDRDLLVNVIGWYDGYNLIMGTVPYTFEITADGNWSYTIERLTPISDTSFWGSGDYVTGLFTASSGAWQFTHDGSSNFSVWIYTKSGSDLLVNEIGTYDGKKMVNIPSDSYSFFEITADGNWTATPVD